MDIQSCLPKYFAVQHQHQHQQSNAPAQNPAYKVFMNTIYLPSGAEPLNVIWPVNNVELNSSYFTPLQSELRPILIRKWNGKTPEPTTWTRRPTNLRILTESEYMVIPVVVIHDDTTLPYNNMTFTVNTALEINGRAIGAASTCPPAKIYTTDPHDKPILPPISQSIHRGATAFELDLEENEPDVECGGSPSMLKVSPKSDAPRIHQLLPSPIGLRRSNSFFNMNTALPYSPITLGTDSALAHTDTHIGVEPAQAYKLQATPHPRMKHSSSLTSLISAASASVSASVSTVAGSAFTSTLIGLPTHRPMPYRNISTNYSIPFTA